MAVLALVAGSLFALRYGLSRRLDLRQPLANFLPESLPGDRSVHRADSTRRNARQSPETPDDGSTPSNQDRQTQGQDPEPEPRNPGVSQSEALARMDAKSIAIQKPGERDDTQMASDDADSEGESTARNGEDSPDGRQAAGKAAQRDMPRNGEKQNAANPGDNSSLMSKLKDAFQNLLSKAKPQPNQEGSPQQGKGQKSSQGRPQSGTGKDGKDGQPRDGSQQGDGQEGEAGQDAKNSETAQPGKGQGKSDSEQSSKQPGSGIGSQDGDKAIHSAEQLAAMGKISEILGKRSANITGEATVEVRTTSQQLRTPYSPKGAEHTQGGAEISRDEVPVALQPYVQQYFEQVRKQPGAKK
jgi:hypothetical protein